MLLVAQEMGLEFSQNDVWGLRSALNCFNKDFFNTTFHRGYHFSNFIPGTVEKSSVFLFDCNERWGDDSRRSIHQSIFVAQLNNPKCPEFRFRHDRWYEAKLINRHRVGGAHGEIRYHEERMNADESQESVTKGLMPELKALLDEPNPAQIEYLNGYLLIYKPNKLLDFQDSVDFYLDCCALTALLQTQRPTPRLLSWAEIKGKDY